MNIWKGIWEGKQGYLHWHTQIQTLLMGCCQEGETEREAKSLTQTEAGDVVEWDSQRKTQEDSQRETDNSSDWWLMKIKTFLLEDMLSFSLPAVIPFFLSSNCSFRCTRCMSECVHADVTEGVSKSNTFFQHFHPHTHRYVQSPLKIFFCCFKSDLFFSHTLSCLVGKVLENLKDFPLAWLAEAPVMIHYVVSLCSLPLQYLRKPVVVKHLQNHIPWWKMHGCFMVTTGGSQKQ